jgi:hypothetical protein
VLLIAAVISAFGGAFAGILGQGGMGYTAKASKAISE